MRVRVGLLTHLFLRRRNLGKVEETESHELELRWWTVADHLFTS